MDGTYAVDSQLYWAAALVTALIDLVFVFLLTRWVDQSRFQRLKIPLVIVAGVTWCVIYTAAVWSFWDTCYGFIFPDWVRWFVIFFGLLMGGVAYLFWWLAPKIHWNPIVTFAILGGLHSLPGHLNGIYGMGLMEKCPILTEVSIESALVFGVFEFVFYWCVILSAAALVDYLMGKVQHVAESEG